MAEVGNIATLGLQIDANGAIRQVESFNAKLTKTGQVADQTTASLKRQDETLRKVAESNLMASTRHQQGAQAIVRANGGYERFRQIQKQIADEMRTADAIAARNVGTLNNVARAKQGVTASSERLRGGLVALASQMTNVNPAVGRLAGTLGSFAMGSGLMIGVLAGLSAVAYAYEKLTSEAQKAKKASDELIDSLLKQRKAAQDASLDGQIRIKAEADKKLAEATVRLERAQAQSRRAAGGSFGSGRDLAGLSVGDPAAAKKEVLDGLDAVLQANLNVNAVIAERERELQRLREENAARLKRIEDEAEGRRKKAFDEEERRIRERIQRLSRINAGGGDAMSAVLGNIGLRTSTPIRLPFEMSPQSEEDRLAIERERERYRAQKEGEDRAREAKMDQQRKRDNAATNIEKLGKAAALAAMTIGQSLSYLLVNKLGGGGIGGSIGAGLGSTLTKGMSAFGMSAGPLGAILGAGLGNIAGKLVGGLFGPSSADREAARKAAAAQRDLAASMDIMRQKAAGANTTLLEQIEANRKYYESLKQQITDTFKGRKNEAERYRLRDEADRMRAAEDEKIRQEFQRTQREKKEDLEVRRLRALGRNEEADAVAIALANERELAQARLAGADAAMIATLREIQKAEADQRAADAAKRAADETKRAADAAAEMAKREYELAEARKKAERGLKESLIGRGLAAMGRGRDAEDARMGFNFREEMREAIAAGMSPSTLATLAFVQTVERFALIAQREIEDQTKAIESAARQQIESIDREIAAIRLISEVESKAIAQQIDAIRDASEREQKAFEDQIDVARTALEVARDQLREQERAVEETRRVFESLTQFTAGLKLNPSLTTLSPIQQMVEARKQYDDLLSRANAGDKTAAGGLPDAARSYLDASRGVNASGPGYVADFQRVQQTLALVRDRFGVQLTVEERILKELEGQTASLEAQLTALQVAKDQAAANAASQIATLQAAKDQAAERANAQIAELERIKEQTRADADRAIAQMIKQVNETLDAKIKSIAYYEEWKRTTDKAMADNVRYFAEMIDKLGRIIEETFRTAENTKKMANVPPPTPTPIPNIPFPQMIAAQEETNTELRAVVNTLYNTARMQEEKLNAVWQAINDNTSATKQGLEAVRV